jgi:hypothetical protein
MKTKAKSDPQNGGLLLPWAKGRLELGNSWAFASFAGFHQEHWARPPLQFGVFCHALSSQLLRGTPVPSAASQAMPDRNAIDIIRSTLPAPLALNPSRRTNPWGLTQFKHGPLAADAGAIGENRAHDSALDSKI